MGLTSDVAAICCNSDEYDHGTLGTPSGAANRVDKVAAHVGAARDIATTLSTSEATRGVRRGRRRYESEELGRPQ
jgi:hypothetical protein